MSASATETIAERIRAKFLNGCSEKELTDLAHSLEEKTSPGEASDVVDSVRSEAVTRIISEAMTHYERNEFGRFVAAIDRATTVARVHVNGYQIGSHNLNWIRDLKKTCDYEYKKLTSIPAEQRQHGYETRTQMGSP